MREVILPVNPAPLISGQTSYTYPLMLLPGGEEAERCFIANSYINCYYDKTYFDIYEQDYYFQNNGLFERRAEYADNRRIESETHSVLMYFYRQICKGYAITGHWNEELVDGATGSSDEECLIHGVDPDDGKLHVISISGASPRSYVVSAETFFKARCTGPEGYIWYVFIKPLKNTVSVIDKEKILSDYRDFICSANRKNVFDDGRSYGIGYIDAYKRYVDSCIKSEERLDALNAVSMLDHKIATKIRLEYLRRHDMLLSDNLIEAYDSVLSVFKRHIEMVTEYNKSLSAEVGSEIIHSMTEAKDRELMCALNLVCSLNDN